LKGETGINFITLALVEVTFKLNKNFKPPKGGIPVDIGVRTKHSFSHDKKTLNTSLSIALFADTKRPPFLMKVTIEGTFTAQDHQELKRFSKINAVAHLFPFVREIIANITTKAGVPPLLLPPINFSALLAEKRK
jgi:preprotein translocase subunit SecB